MITRSLAAFAALIAISTGGSTAVIDRADDEPTVLALNLGQMGLGAQDQRTRTRLGDPNRRGAFERGGDSGRTFGPVHNSRLGSYTGRNLGSYTGEGVGSWTGGGMGGLSTFGTDASSDFPPPRD